MPFNDGTMLYSIEKIDKHRIILQKIKKTGISLLFMLFNYTLIIIN